MVRPNFLQPVPLFATNPRQDPMFITPAYAQDMSGIMSSASQFVPLILIFIVFYFLMIRPQQQRQKEARAMLAAIKRGDRIVTAGGIVAQVTKVPPDRDGKPVSEIEVEIAPNVRVTVLRDTIGSVIKPTPANDTK
jgi:preprotein translocase subunit YajC